LAGDNSYVAAAKLSDVKNGDEEARLADLERRGIIRRGRGGIESGILKPGPRPGGRPTSDLLIEERRSGRRGPGTTRRSGSTR
jgi:hypothetical protein